MERQSMEFVQGYREETYDRLLDRIHTISNNLRIQAKYLKGMDDISYRSEGIHQIIMDILKDHPTLIDLLIIDKKGSVVNSRGGPVAANLKERSYVIDGLNGKSSITGFYKGKGKNAIIMTIAHPIIIEGRPEYVLAGVVSLEKIKYIIENIDFNNAGQAFLVDQEGVLITTNDYIERYKRKVDVSKLQKLDTMAVNEVIQHKQGTKKYVDFMGKKVFGSYQWINEIGVGLVVEIKEDYVLSPMRDLIRRIKISGAIVIALAIILAYHMSKRFFGSLEQLIYAVEQLKTKSDTNVIIDIRCNNELDILIERFNEMQRAIQKREEEIQRYAAEDTLTESYNRRVGLEYLSRKMQEASYTDSPLSIIFVDINDLKYVNDHLGHSEGDKLIQLTVDMIRNNIRKTDMIARLGGDEFLVILSECTEERAYGIWEEICGDIKNHNEKRQEKFLISVSFGIMEYDSKDIKCVDDFVELADKKMYEYKQTYKKSKEYIENHYGHTR